MTIPSAPLPTISRLFGAFIVKGPGTDVWSGANWDVRLYRRGAAAFAAGLEVAGGRIGVQRVRLWVPDYVCEDLLELLPGDLTESCFYPVSQDLSPDWSWIKAHHEPFDGLEVFVLVHYFGFPNTAGKASAFCRERGLVLFEDGAHVIRVHQGIGEGDMTFLSPWKLLGLPMGGLLLTPPKRELPVPEVTRVPQLLSFTTAHWLLVRMAQQFCRMLHIPWHAFLGSQTLRARGEIRGPATACWSDPVDRASQHILNTASRDLENVIRLRRRNYESLMSFVSELSFARPLFPTLGEEICPYAFPLLVDAGCGPVAESMNQHGILTSRWPDLPTAVVEAPTEHPVAISLYNKLLLIPVHQSLRDKEMEAIGRFLQSLERTLA